MRASPGGNLRRWPKATEPAGARRMRSRSPRGFLGLSVGILVSTVFLALSVAPSPAHDLKATVAEVKPSIVGIGTYLATRRPPARLKGTGFAIADGQHVITSLHVVDGALNDERREELTVFVGQGTDIDRRTAEIVIEDKSHDLVLLKISGAALPPLELGDDNAVADGQDIAFTGFPIGAILGLFPATHRGIVATRVPIAIPLPGVDGLDATVIKQLEEPFLVFQLDATAYPGNSGSPLYDAETGAVLGVISSTFVKSSRERVLSDPSGITYAIPATHIAALLEAIR